MNCAIQQITTKFYNVLHHILLPYFHKKSLYLQRQTDTSRLRKTQFTFHHSQSISHILPKMKPLLLCLFALLTIRVAAQDSIHVAFWNMENYFDTWHDTLKNDYEFLPEGSYHWTPKRFYAKRNNLYKTIVAMENPIVIGLAEVENDHVLEELCQGTPLRKLGFKFVHYESPDQRGVDCALLYQSSRFKVLESQPCNMSDSTEGFFTRDILLVGGVVDSADTLFVLVNHWPSQLGGERAARHRDRISKELDRLCDSLAAAHPQATIVTMGDFNSQLAQGNGLGSYKYQGVWSWIDNIFLYGECRCGETPTKAYQFDWLLTEDKTYMGEKPYRAYLGVRYQGGVSDHLPVWRNIPVGKTIRP